jgi:hypothetical protein
LAFGPSTVSKSIESATAKVSRTNIAGSRGGPEGRTRAFRGSARRLLGCTEVRHQQQRLAGADSAGAAVSVMSTRFGLAEPPEPSIPGSAVAKRRKSNLMLKFPFALVSINMTPSSEAFVSPSSDETCLLSERSVLFPTSMMTTSFPRSERTSSIH